MFARLTTRAIDSGNTSNASSFERKSGATDSTPGENNVNL
jgi:hypothetical protein